MGSDARRRSLLTAAVLVVVSLLAGLLSGCGPDADAAPTGPPELVVNGNFQSGTDGWRTNQSHTVLTIGPGRDGGSAGILTSPPGTVGVLNDKTPTVTDAKVGEGYRVSAWVKTNQPTMRGAVRIREVRGESVRPVAKTFDLESTDWHLVEFGIIAHTDGANFDLNIIGYDFLAGQQLWISDVSVRAAGLQALPGPATASPSSDWRLSNGVALSERGIPAHGALVGAAVGGNADPSAFEAEIGQRLGIRRTYWAADQVDVAVRTARSDLAAGRLPWISFKLPYAWDRMAAGDGDEWTRDLAAQLAELPGPVWVAFHHEPEGDGPIKDWKAMQERLGPIVRQAAPNVGFTVILTGWNQLQGAAKYDLDKIWPHTTVDLAGFDLYNMYGSEKDGKVRLVHTDLKKTYFDQISRWAASKKVAWGLAETGISDEAAADNPRWLRTMYADLVEAGGSALCYFNSSLNSTASWVITSEAKAKLFSRVMKMSPTFPELS